jgi:hypothetical protein
MLAPGTVKVSIRQRQRKQIPPGKYGLVVASPATYKACAPAFPAELEENPYAAEPPTAR